MINEANPRRYIDIGTRIDVFAAHASTFRRIEILDVRKLNSVGHTNIMFVQANLIDSSSIQNECTDSISCPHAIEHYGLGHYGDPLDPNGHIKWFQNIIRMVKSNGKIFISFSIGKTNSVEFNAHRIFNPQDILNWQDEWKQLQLKHFHYVDDN